MADSIGISQETCLIICGVFGFIVTLLMINQIVASLSDTKRVPKAQGSSLLGSTDQKRKKVRDRFLLAGPTNSGKTQLYYKLIGGSISDSVSSSDLN